MDSNLGKRLGNRYELTELIGEGGMANVYKATDTLEDKVVAVKVLKEEFSADTDFLRRFRNECKAVSILSHPNIVKIFDVELSDDSLKYIVMEYIDGITLKDFIEAQSKIDWKNSILFISQVLKALQHAHDKGIVHRDIKPQNIMLVTDGTIKVMDFGIARFSRVDGKTASDKTIGSVHYISPEQARGDMTDERSDIYSVGIVLYEMLTGQKPFDGEGTVAIALKHMQEQATYVCDIEPSVPNALAEVVEHAMEKNPEDRYQNAAEMLKDLDMVRLNPDTYFGYRDKNSNTETPENTDDGTTRRMDTVNTNFMPQEAFEKNTPPDDFNNNSNYEQPVYDNNQDYDDGDYDDYEDDEEEEVEEKRSYLIPIMLATTAAIVVIAAVIIGFSLIKSINIGSSSKVITIDNFVGQSITDVENNYKNLLIFDVTEENNSEYEAGVIFQQEDAVGKNVKSGYTVRLKVSKGPKTTAIPDVTKMTESVATSELQKYGFTVGKINVYSDDILEGYVIKTYPEAGKEWADGGEVTIYVSKGEESKTVKVPNLDGMDKNQAKSALETNKLTPKFEEVDTDEVEAGKVVTQSIAAGQFVDKQSEVIVTISTGRPAAVTMSFNMPVPNGAWGSYKVDVYSNGAVTVSQNIDKAELVAGSNISITVTGSGTDTLTIFVTNNTSGDSVQYASYDVDYKAKTANQTSLNTSGFLGITPQQTTPSQHTEPEPEPEPEPYIPPETTTSTTPPTTTTPPAANEDNTPADNRNNQAENGNED